MNNLFPKGSEKELESAPIAAATIRKLKAENKRLSMRCKQQENYNKTLMAQNRRLLSEYIKTWDVLRTYNPKDIELEYIGFEPVEVLDAPDQ